MSLTESANDPQFDAYAALFRQSSDAILLLRETRLWANSAARILLGYEETELATLGLAGLFEASAASVEEFFQRLNQDGHAFGDFPVHRKGRTSLMNIDGTVLQARYLALLIRLPGGAPDFAQGPQHNEIGLRAVVDALPDMFWIKDPAGAYIMVNKAFSRWSGRVPAELIGRNDYDLTTPALADLYRMHDAVAMLAQGPSVYEVKGRGSGDAQESVVRTTKMALRAPDGGVIGVLGIAQDISALRSEEAQLQANNAVLASIVRGAPLGETLGLIARNIESQYPDMLCSIMLLSEDGQHLRIGSAEALPATWLAVIDGAKIGPAVGSCGTALYRGEPVFVDDITKSPLWTDWAAAALAHGLAACWSTPIRAANGELLGSLAIYYRQPRHATEAELRVIQTNTGMAGIVVEGHNIDLARRRAAHQLRAQEATLALALHGSGTGVWDRDMRTNVVTYSSGWKALFGFSDADLPDDSPRSVGRVHADDLPAVKQAFQDYLNGKTEIYEVEHRACCADGSDKWVISRGRIVERDADDAPLRMIGTTTDINALRALTDELRQGRDLITNLTNQVPGMVYQYRRMPDGTAQYPYASEGIRGIYGLTPEQVAHDAGMIEARIHPQDRAQYALSLTVSANELAPWHLEYRVVLPQQGEGWRLGDARPQKLADGSVLWHGFITDISERKRLEKTIIENEAQHRTVTENSPDLIMRYDRSYKRIYVNQRYEKLSGIPMRELIGSAPSELAVLGPQNLAALDTMMRKVFESGVEAEVETRLDHDGLEKIYQTRAIPEFDADGNVTTVLTFSHDITERKRLEAELQFLAITDFLTGLPNRRHFVERLDDELARIQRLGRPQASVLMIDIDHFKTINDRYGHAAGDCILRQFAELARLGLRRVDTVGRVGGEEFAMILAGAQCADAAGFAERLRKKIESSPCVIEACEVSFTISIGVTAIRPDDANADAIMRRADKALYRAKEKGRNRAEVEHD